MRSKFYIKKARQKNQDKSSQVQKGLKLKKVFQKKLKEKKKNQVVNKN